MTHPSVQAPQSGEAADAVRTLQARLSSEYSEIRSAEIQLAEAILSAHAVTVSARARLQDIQRELVDAITDPVAALDTPAGERHFLLFLRSKVAEIQAIVDTGALTDEDHARLTRALASGYLVSASADEASDAPPPPAAGGAPAADQGAGLLPALGSALSALPQAAQGAAAAPAQGAGAAAPLAGLASGLMERDRDAGPVADDVDRRAADDTDTAGDDEDTQADGNGDEDRPGGEDTDAGAGTPQEPDDRDLPKGPAATRPAHLPEERR